MNDTTHTIDSFLARAPALLEGWRPEHSPIQLEHFVVGNMSCGDVWGAYVQAMRELDGRWRGLEMSKHSTEALELDLEEAFLERTDAETKKLEEAREGKLGQRRHSLRKRRAQLAVNRATTALAHDATSRESAAREAHTVLEIAVIAREAVGELTEERRIDLEWQFVATRFAQKITFQRMAGSPIGEEIMVTFQRMPERYQKQVQEALQGPLPSAPATLREPLLDVMGAVREHLNNGKERPSATAIAGGG